MYRLLQDFQQDWAREAAMTHKIMEALSDEALQQQVAPGGRSLGFLAWHITQALKEMLGQAGIAVDGPDGSTAMPTHASDITTAFEGAARSVSDKVLQTWTDEMLTEKVELYGMQCTRGQALCSLITHQAHHRGQMTVLMRQAGLTVPGTYGPAREEWAAMGIPPMQ